MVVKIAFVPAIKLCALKAAQKLFTILSKIVLYSVYKKPK